MSLGDVRVAAESRPRPFQFSLRTMFIVTTIVAIVCGGLFAPWDWLQSLTLFFLCVTVSMAIVVALIYSRGYARTFWIGALFPAAAILLAAVTDGAGRPFFGQSILGLDSNSDPYLNRVAIALSLLVIGTMILLAGLIAIGVRWMVESPQRGHAKDAIADAPRSGADHSPGNEG